MPVSSERDIEDDDPAVSNFLASLAEDIKKHPERVREFPAALLERMTELTKEMKVNLDDPIVGGIFAG